MAGATNNRVEHQSLGRREAGRARAGTHGVLGDGEVTSGGGGGSGGHVGCGPGVGERKCQIPSAARCSIAALPLCFGGQALPAVVPASREWRMPAPRGQPAAGWAAKQARAGSPVGCARAARLQARQRAQAGLHTRTLRLQTWGTNQDSDLAATGPDLCASGASRGPRTRAPERRACRPCEHEGRVCACFCCGGLGCLGGARSEALFRHCRRGGGAADGGAGGRHGKGRRSRLAALRAGCAWRQLWKWGQAAAWTPGLELPARRCRRLPAGS